MNKPIIESAKSVIVKMFVSVFSIFLIFKFVNNINLIIFVVIFLTIILTLQIYAQYILCANLSRKKIIKNI